MTIATKSGGLIVKDGRLAQNCGCCATLECGCNMSISALMPTTASSSFKGTVLSRAESCNCHIANWPNHFIGTLCTSDGIVVSITYTDGMSSGRMRSSPLTLDPAGPCGTNSYPTVCTNFLGPGDITCGTLGWPATTTTLTFSDFTYFSGVPYDNFSFGPSRMNFPTWIKVMPSANPLP
jgi:hypothetical protein